ncbi:acid phosphatase type 7-like isoform X2 [Episyrphus balteatus]|uniref:acid phosphatase type 7-like isoform X2 n=1 Tax=Episyrphus balteatus TaxID=286459 RepID=UPI0024855E23|nr:acid phosphatase type 7-like isoform X2 [Episyrphus balteatus]
MKRICIFLTLFFIVNGEIDKVFHYQPEQVHLSFGDLTNEIVVTWSTRDDSKESIVEYGETAFEKLSKSKPIKFVDGGKEKSTQYIHEVTLSNLKPSTHYIYHCGSSLGWSAEFWFVTQPNGTEWSPRLAIFGDMGNENAQSLARLQQDTQRGLYDAIIHVGDFAYDMDSENARVGDEFMNQIQSVAAYLPYMVCAGNHEERYNFSNYRSRFSMPGGTDNLMYSFNIGPVHFIGFSTELYYYLNYGIKPLVNQYDWLEKDLQIANQPENRALRPWIVTFGHRPMYCSNDNGDDCSKHNTVIRKGLPLLGFFGLEDLFYKFGVDVMLWAHEHSYERLWPIYDYKMFNGSHEEPYKNPGSPVHLVTGSAGCKEGREPFDKIIPEWSAFHSRDYGYTKMTAHNTTHLYFEQVSDDKNGEIIDSFWIIKEKHGSYL